MSQQPEPAGTRPHSCDAITLAAFFDLHSNALPQTVRVQSGFGPGARESGCERLSIVEANCSQVISAETINGEEFFVPLNTNTKFSLLYNPTGDIKEAVQGFVFKTVADLKEVSPRPKLVCTKTSWKRSDLSEGDEELLLEANEILVLTDSEKNTDGRSGLLVFSMNTRATKFLPDDCSPVFSTAGSRLPLHLPDILAYVPRPLPCEACIVKQEQPNKCYPSNVVALTALATTTVLKCAVVRGDAQLPGADHVPYYVPVNLPGVEVIVETQGGEDKSETTALPAKDALTGELTCQLVMKDTPLSSSGELRAQVCESTSHTVEGVASWEGEDRGINRTSSVTNHDHLYETIPDVTAKCNGLSKPPLVRSNTGSSTESFKLRHNMSASSLDRVNRSCDGDTPIARSSSASPHHGQASPLERGCDHVIVTRRPSRKGSTKESFRRPSTNEFPSKLAYNGQLNAVTGQINHSWV